MLAGFARSRVILFVASCGVGLWVGGGCQRSNPAFNPGGVASDGPVVEPGADASATPDQGGVDRDAAPEAGRDAGFDGAPPAPDVREDTVGDVVRDGGIASDAPARLCSTPSECAMKLGSPPCGSWICPSGTCQVACSNCMDGDGDGYGSGNGCAGRDCDDRDPAVGLAGEQSCYGGPAGTETKGTCRKGRQTCIGGVWTSCFGQVVPSGEACNGQDDDCDGATDESLGMFTCGVGACRRSVPACGSGGAAGMCVAVSPSTETCGDTIDNNCDGAVDEGCGTDACVRVAPGGVDVTASLLMPFGTIQAAINYAAADSSRPQKVCVAQGPSCTASHVYRTPVDVSLTMAAGVAVLGGFESSGWTRCNQGTGGALNPRVSIETAGTATTTVLFPPTASGAALDGFRISRSTSGSGGTAAITGITIDGAKDATVSKVIVNDSPSANATYGINLKNGAEATIADVAVSAGNGAVEAVGIRSSASRPAIRGSCPSLDAAGRCRTGCDASSSTSGVRARTADGSSGETYGVLLVDSPGAVIEQSAVCGANAKHGAAIKVVGEGKDVVIRGSFVTGAGGELDSHGIWLEDCNGAAPWIVDNYAIESQGDSDRTRVRGIHSVGRCHPVIDGNLRITGGVEGTSHKPIGVYCGANTSGEPSRCVIVGNRLIAGSGGNFPPEAVGVRCDDGACARIAGNVIAGASANDVVGVWLYEAGPLVERNIILGGCARASAAGLYAERAFARIENNVISAGDCRLSPAQSYSPRNSGLVAIVGSGGGELDVHSNFIDARGDDGPCIGSAVVYRSYVGPPPTPPPVPRGPMGAFRNNILRSGFCEQERHLFFEYDAMADPKIFQNNDLDPAGGPTSLYWDEGTTAITDVMSVNALTETSAAANLASDPKLVSYPSGDYHLTPGSPCADRGASVAAPTIDADGKMRADGKPDIGPYEL